MQVISYPHTHIRKVDGRVGMLDRSRGISEIIGSLMILLIISALGTILYNYSLDAMNYQKNVLESDIRIALDKAQVRIKVISTQSNYSANILNLTILNYGVCSVTLDDVYVNNSNVQTYLDGQGVTIPPMDLGKISFVSPIPIIQDALYDIVIVSLRGVTHAYRSEM